MRMMVGHIVVSLLAVLLLIYSGYLMISSGFNFGLLLIYLLTAFFAAWALFYKAFGFFWRSFPGKILLGLVSVAAVLGLSILAFILYSAHSRPPTGREKAMVVLGAGLREDRPSRMLRCRLDRAFEYYQEHPEILIVTTGGQGRNELVPEGYAMKKYLVEKGIPEEQIISEEASTSTEENFLFSKELMKERGVEAKDAILVISNAFHCYRGMQYAAMAGFENVTALPAATPITAIMPSYMREVAALVYYWLFRSSRTGFINPLVGIMSINKKFFYR